MPANPIVEALDVLKHGSTRLLMCLENDACDTFALETPKEALHHGIIRAVSRPAHTHLNAPRRQQLLLALTGVLRPPI